MGMYDTIRCNRKMPDGYEGEYYQSKNLDCSCSEYEISNEGRLLKTCINSGDGIRKIIPVDMNFHGHLNFYDSTKNGWKEYNAKFTDGNLVSIEVVQ